IVVWRDPGATPDRRISTWSKSFAFGSFHVSRTSLLPTVTLRPLTSSGGVRSTTGGGGCGVPGGGCGRTVSTAVARALFPLASVAVNVIVVAPTGSTAGASFVIVGCGSTMSLAEAAARNAWTGSDAEGMPVSLVAFTKLAGGTTIRGGVVSTTVTSKLAEAVFPCESVAVHVTLVLPSGKVFPEPGVQVTVVVPTGKLLPDAGLHVGVRSPSTTSWAVAAG